MRRYDALSHNSYLHAIAPLGHVEDGAANAPGAIAREDSVVGQTERGSGRLGGVGWRFA